MRWFRFLAVAIVAVLLQATVVRLLAIHQATPDLLLAVLVVFSVGVRAGEGFGVGCMVGLLRDAYSTEPFGLGIGSFALLGYLVARARAGAVADHPVTHALLGLVCSAASSGVSLAAVAIGQQAHSPSAGWAVRHLFITAGLTAVASALIGRMVWRRHRWFGLRRGAEFVDV